MHRMLTRKALEQQRIKDQIKMNNRNKMKRRNSEVFEAFKMFDRDGDGKVS